LNIAEYTQRNAVRPYATTNKKFVRDHYLSKALQDEIQKSAGNAPKPFMSIIHELLKEYAIHEKNVHDLVFDSS
jgi:hypothetical protein